MISVLLSSRLNSPERLNDLEPYMSIPQTPAGKIFTALLPSSASALPAFCAALCLRFTRTSNITSSVTSGFTSGFPSGFRNHCSGSVQDLAQGPLPAAPERIAARRRHHQPAKRQQQDRRRKERSDQDRLVLHGVGGDGGGAAGVFRPFPAHEQSMGIDTIGSTGKKRAVIFSIDNCQV